MSDVIFSKKSGLEGFSIKIDPCGIGDAVQYTSLPENYFRATGKRLVDVQKHWCFDHNPYVLRNRTCVKIHELWTYFDNPPLPGLPKVRDSVYMTNAEVHAAQLGIKNPTLIRPRLYEFEKPLKSKYARKETILFHPFGKSHGALPDRVISHVLNKYGVNGNLVQLGTPGDPDLGLRKFYPTDLWSLAEGISLAKMFIGIDSGPAWIAACYPDVITKKIRAKFQTQGGIVEPKDWLPLSEKHPHSIWDDRTLFKMYWCGEDDLGFMEGFWKNMKEQPIYGMLLILFFIVFVQKIPLTLRFIWAYFLGITAYHAIDQFYAPEFAPKLSNVIAWSAANYFVWMSLIPLFLINTNEAVKKSLITTTKWFMVYCAVVLLLGKSPSVWTANTFDASLIACFILFWDLNFKRKWFTVFEWIGFLISLTAIIWVKGRDAELILGVSLSAYYFPKFFWKILFPFGVFIAGMCSYFMYSGGVEPRFEMWESFMNWWTHYANIWIGAGIGSFEWVGPYLDPGFTYRRAGVGFYVMHNEWLTLLFESGIIGLVLGLIGYVIIASKLKGRDFAVWLGIGAGMVWYYILHAWPVQLLAIILISRMGKKDE